MKKFQGAKVTGCEVVTPKGKTPHVKVNFEYIDNGQTKFVSYFGYLSKSAYPYTIERLQKNGLRGELRNINDILAFQNMTSGLSKEGISIKIETQEHKGKSYDRVTSFWTQKVLTASEKTEVAKNLLNYFKNNEKTDDKTPTESKTKEPVAETKDVTKKFNADEDLGF